MATRLGDREDAEHASSSHDESPARLVRRRELGAGAMGVVYEAFDRKQQCLVAAKTLRDLDGKRLLGLKQEFRRLRDIHHHNLVRLGELIEERGSWCFTMELVRGVPFLDYLRGRQADEGGTGGSDMRTATVAHAPPPLTQTRQLGADGRAGGAEPAVMAPALRERIRPAFAQLVRAVLALHEHGIVHRDLKSSNILVTPEGRVVVLDFGIALLVGDDAATIAGTPSYMAPEQLALGSVGPAADWYAVGTLLFVALTGQFPFGRDLEAIVARKRAGDWQDPRLFAPDLPTDLAELCWQLLHPDPARRAGGREAAEIFGGGTAATTVASTSAAIFVGRRAELEGLTDAFSQVRRGNPTAVVLQGASGLGKSALLDEFLARQAADTPATLVLRGRCHERELVPFKAFDAVIDQLASALSLRPGKHWMAPRADEAGALAALFPVLGQVLPEADAPRVSADASERRDQAFAALAGLLYEVARRRPLIVTIDDIHWADADSLALLEELTAARPAIPWLLVMATRPPDDGASVPALAHVRMPMRLIDMAPLPDDEARTLAERMVALSPGLDIAVDALIAESGGHPMFIDALVSEAAAGGARATSRGADIVSLDDTLRRRAEGLPASERALLELIVTAGAPIPLESLRHGSGLAGEALAEGLAHLVATRLARAGDLVEPYHDRIREALYGSLEPGHRQRLHDRLADALLATAAAPEVLVPHLLASGRTLEAAEQAHRAATLALSAFAFERAAELFAIALEHGAPDRDRLALVTCLADALAGAGRPYDAALRFLEAAELAAGDDDARRDLRRRAGAHLIQGGYITEGLELTRAVLAEVGMSLPKTRTRSFLRYVWNDWRLSRHPLTWTSRAERDLPMRELLRLDAGWAVLTGMSMVDSMLSVAETLRNSNESLRVGEPMRIARSLSTSAIGRATLGERDQFDRSIAAAERAVDETGQESLHFYLDLGRGMGAGWMDDDWAAARAHLERARACWQRSHGGDSWELDAVEFQIFAARAYLGDQPVTDEVDAAIRRAKRRGNRFVEVNLRCTFGNRWLLLDDPDAGEQDVTEAHQRWHQRHKGFTTVDYVALRSLTELALYRRPGDPAKLAALARSWNRFGRSMLQLLGVLAADGTLYRAQLELRLAELTEGRRQRRHLRRAERHIKALTRAWHPSARGYAAMASGWLATLRGERDRAVAHFTRAIEEARARPRLLLLHTARVSAALLEGHDADHPHLQDALAFWTLQGAAHPRRMLTYGLPAALAAQLE